MPQFKMACMCGDTMTLDAEDRAQAVHKFKTMMDEGAIKTHMAEKHPGQPVMSVKECHDMIEKDVVAA